MIDGLLALVVTLMLVVGFHECGHALAARLLSVKIQRVAIGFGKPLWQRVSRSGLEWVWGRWPLGGYVSLLNTRIKPVDPPDVPRSFDHQAVWVRCLILLAGGVANGLLAWVGFAVFYALGHQESSAVIKTVIPQTLSATAGLVAGETLVAINAIPVRSWQTASMQLLAALGQSNVRVIVQTAQGHLLERTLDLSSPSLFKRAQGFWRCIGLEPDGSRLHLIEGQPLTQAVLQAAETLVQWLFFFLIVIKQVLLARLPVFLLLGPMGLFEVAATSWIHGISVFSYFIASLSLAVGFVNLLPIPGLDGGSIGYALLEKIRGKPVSIALEVLLHRLATIALLVFLAQLLGNDLQRIL